MTCRVTSMTLKNSVAYKDWVLIERCEETEAIKKIGSLYIPDSVDMHVMESKIGRIISVGGGHTDTKGRFHKLDIRVGHYCYFTRYGKLPLETEDGRYVFTRNRGVLAYVYFEEDGNPNSFIKEIVPRFDRLLVEEIPLSDKNKLSGMIQLANQEYKVDDYRYYKVHNVGMGEPLRRKGSKLIDPNDVRPCEVRVGDEVISSMQSGVKVSFLTNNATRKEFRLIPESECVAYIRY